ncbi:MAG: PHP domain-containing protein, partial [Novosphingobium sp.]|nr:PHP domain-containing protein [Novosphingobium sp.]
MEYENIHKHTHYSNIYTPDCIIKPEDIARRAAELGQQCITTIEHGYIGNTFEYYDMAKAYGLKLIIGAEFYFVYNRLEKDKSNYHMNVLAKTNQGIKQLKKMMSKANYEEAY